MEVVFYCRMLFYNTVLYNHLIHTIAAREQIVDKAVVKAFSLLEMLAKSEYPLGVTALAAQADLGKSNVHRLLQTLHSMDYVRKTAENTYEPTLKVWELGSYVVSRLNVREQARPVMRLLSEMTKETVHLSELDGAEVLYIDKIESKEPVRAYTQLGGRGPAYCTATGKAMLAYAESEQVAACLENAQSFTQKTIVNTERFTAEVRKIRKQRYAINRGEWRADVIGIGAPIFGDQGNVIGAIGLSAPASRMHLDELTTLAPQLVEYAERLSLAMGCSEQQWAMAGDASVIAGQAAKGAKAATVSGAAFKT